MSEQKFSIWKLLGGIAITIIVVIVSCLTANSLGLIGKISTNAVIAIATIIITLSLKSVLGSLASGSFDYHKHGYDFCVLVLGSSISLLTLQLTSTSDLFENAGARFFWGAAARISDNVITQRIIMLIVLLLLGLLFSLLTAMICKAIREGAKFPALLSILNFLFGSSLLILNLLLILSKT